jgi:Domain of unknown function (DUF1737)
MKRPAPLNMNKFTGYKIVNHADSSKVEEEVSELMKQGYIPFGGVECSSHEGKIEIFQAMVKVQEPQEPR